jgi:Tol biopolymer transport system component
MSGGAAEVVSPVSGPARRASGHRLRWLHAVLVLELCLTWIVGFVAWRVTHTAKPPLQSEAQISTRLAWVNRSGRILDTIDLAGHYIAPRMSSKGDSLLLTRVWPGGVQVCMLSMADHKIKAFSPRAVQAAFGVSSPDGERLVFSVWHGMRAEIFETTEAQSRGRLLLKDDWSDIPEDWSPDGKWLAFTGSLAGKSQIGLLRRNTSSSHSILGPKAGLSEIRFSPDGRWVALTLTAAGLDGVYTAPIDLRQAVPRLRDSDLIRVSPRGGHSPDWGPDSNELFFIARDGALYSDAPKASPGSLHRLFSPSSLGSLKYRYRFDSYCFDRGRSAFVAAFTGFVR